MTDYYSRFIRSRRNIFLVGERGAGKTMTLLYNSFPAQALKGKPNCDIICVYIPCNTPLTHKREYQLIEEFGASVVSEHFFVVSIMHSIVDTLSKTPNLITDSDNKELQKNLKYVLGIEPPQNIPIFDGLKLFFNKEVADAQKTINAKKLDVFYENSMSFSSGVMPLISCLKKCTNLKNSHFALMIDDAHDLNPHQNKVLNSWIAYRDHSISFKVATTQPSFLTSSGGTILEGHDFTIIGMEQPYQNAGARVANWEKHKKEAVKAIRDAEDWVEKLGIGRLKPVEVIRDVEDWVEKLGTEQKKHDQSERLKKLKERIASQHVFDDEFKREWTDKIETKKRIDAKENKEVA